MGGLLLSSSLRVKRIYSLYNFCAIVIYTVDKDKKNIYDCVKHF